MIKKLSKIKNIGSFLHFIWDGINPPQVPDKNGVMKDTDSEFKKYNILFGENGAGKSTLVRVFKALHQDNGDEMKKHWDRPLDGREVEVFNDGGLTSFTEPLGWQNNLYKDKFVFFDRDFISNYVHAGAIGRTSGHDKNTGKLVLYLGGFQAYREQLDNLDALHGELIKSDGQLKQSRDLELSLLTTTYPEHEIMGEYSALKTSGVSAVSETQISEAKEAVVKQEAVYSQIDNNLSRSREIESIRPLSKVDALSIFDSGSLLRSLGFSISSGAIEALKRMSGKEDFILTGLDAIRATKLEQCPFCEQSIKDAAGYIHVIKEYEEVFNEKFSSARAEASRTLEDYRRHLLGLLSFKIPEGYASQLDLINKTLGTQITLPVVVLSKEDTQAIRDEFALVEDKAKEPLQKMESEKSVVVAGVVNRINSDIVAFNKVCEEVNASLTKTKEDLKSGDLAKRRISESAALQAAKLKAFVLGHFQEVAKILKKDEFLRVNAATINDLETLLHALQAKVKERFSEFVTKYFADIESYVKKFCPSLNINVSASRVAYDRRSSEVVCSFEVQYKGEDRLQELSEGERQGIALSYFLAYLDKLPGKAEKILVFDDPITSFDAGKRKMCSEYIFKAMSSFMQGFVLTCDSLFKKFCLKVGGSRFGSDRNFYYVLKSASSSVHHRSKDVYSVYAFFKSELRNTTGVLGMEENIIVYGQKLRYCIEEVKDKYLGYEQDSFDAVLRQVVGANFAKLQVAAPDLLEIYSYCNTGGLAHYPRDGQTSWEELKLNIRRYLGLGI